MVIYEYRPDFRRFSSLEFVDEQQSSLLIRLLYSDSESTRAYDGPMIRVRRATEGYMATEPNDLPFGRYTGFDVWMYCAESKGDECSSANVAAMRPLHPDCL